MLTDSKIKIDTDVETEIKINDKGKLLGSFEDKLGDPLEKIGWGRADFDNKNLTKCNLKAYPWDFDKNFRLKIHPKYLTDENAIHECVAANVYLSQITESHFTDDTFFTGEWIRPILSIFARTDINYNQKCILLAAKFHENLKNFAAENGNMLGECGGNTRAILLGKKDGGPTNDSNRNGSAMRISMAGIFVKNLFELWKIVLSLIRNTHYHEHSFDAARSVASVGFFARANWSQESIANYINLEFRGKYTQFVGENDINKRRKKFKYKNGDPFFNFDMSNCTLQSVLSNIPNYKYSETALDTVVLALRIIRVAGSFYEASVLAKAHGGDSDTLLAIVLGMAALVFGIPEDIQNETKNQLKIHTSEQLRSYAQLSDEMDKQFSNQYPENIPLQEQLKQTYNIILEIMKNEKRDIDTINKSIGFNKEVDKIIYSNNLPNEFSWDQKQGTFLFYFVLIPIVAVGIAFYLLSSELALIALLVICILDFIAFRITTKAMVKDFFSKKENLLLSKSNISQSVQELQPEISIDNNGLEIDGDILNIDNEVTKSDEFKQLIKSIIKDWNFYLNPNEQYDLNQRKEFEYEVDGKKPEFKEEDYNNYLNTLKEYKTSCETELKELTKKLTGSDQRLAELKQKLINLNKQLTEVKADAKETNTKITNDIQDIERKIEEINNDKNRADELPKIIKETGRQINEVELGAKEMYDAYISKEKTLYGKINAHNKATAEFRTQKKDEKLKILGLKERKQIKDYVTKINQIAGLVGIKERIEFNEKRLLEWQKKTKEEQINKQPKYYNKEEENQIDSF